MNYDKAATLKDIAKAVGVDVSTVSRALNGSPMVRPKLKKTIEDTTFPTSLHCQGNPFFNVIK